MSKVRTQWPKVLPPLSAEQKAAREKFMMLWHQVLPAKYGIIERFNHGYIAKLDYKPGIKTLEIGAGLGEHAKFENLGNQDYYCQDFREEFCSELRKTMPSDRVACGDIQQKQGWPDQTFDRIIAIHVLEHLPNLPAALTEIDRLMKDDGVLDLVLPTEGGLAYSCARKISAERLFKKNFKMDYTPIVRNEHVSTYSEVVDELQNRFAVVQQSYFPLRLPIATINLVVGLRLKKKLPELATV